MAVPRKQSVGPRNARITRENKEVMETGARMPTSTSTIHVCVVKQNITRLTLFRRWFIILLPTLLLAGSGCRGPGAMRAVFLGYAEVYAEISNQQLLLNL